MARKKTTRPEPLPREQQPQFIEALKYLPADDAALVKLAGDMLELFNDAVRTNSLSQMESAALRYSLVVYRLNGDTFFACGVDDGSMTRLKRQLAAPAGTVPGWGQAGEWLIEIDGMRIRVESDAGDLNHLHSVDFRAVDADALFLSSSGYRSHFMAPERWLGHSFGGAVRLELERLLQGDCKPCAIDAKYRDKGFEVPAWLARALASVTDNGQLAMPLNGEALSVAEPEKKGPLSNAERQREWRKRQREQKDALKKQDLRTVVLDSRDRNYLCAALDYYEFCGTNCPGGDYMKANLLELYRRIDPPHALSKTEWPADHARAAWRHKQFTAENHENYKAQALQKANTEIQQLKAALQQIAQEVGGVPVKVAAPAGLSEVERLRAEVEALRRHVATEVADRAKAFEAVAVLQERLKKAGLVHDYRRQPGE